MNASPEWLSELCEQVLEVVCPLSPNPPWGCHIFRNEPNEQWEVTIFASHTEVQGGAADGKMIASNFYLDLSELQAIFDSVHEFHWQALSQGEDDDVGAHISLDGVYKGEALWLRIPSNAPQCFEAGRVLNTREMELQNRW